MATIICAHPPPPPFTTPSPLQYPSLQQEDPMTTATTLRRRKMTKKKTLLALPAKKAWRKLKISLKSKVKKLKTCSINIKRRLASSKALSRIFRGHQKPYSWKPRRHSFTPVYLEDLYECSTDNNATVAKSADDRKEKEEAKIAYSHCYQYHPADDDYNKAGESGAGSSTKYVDEVPPVHHVDETQPQEEEEKLMGVDLRAEQFIAKFHEEIRRQRSFNEHHQMIPRRR